jgi:hypothetical protein
MAYKTERLKSRIVEKYGDQKSFAQASGINRSKVCRLLKGETEWSGSDMMKAVRLLNIPFNEIDVYFFDDAVEKSQSQKV